MQCEYFALEGLTDLVNTIKQVHANLNKNLQIVGLLRVMFDPRITLQQQVSDQLKAHFGDKVFDTVIPRNVRLAEAPSYGLPGVIFDPSAKGSQAFVAFATEMVARLAAKKAGVAPSGMPSASMKGSLDTLPDSDEDAVPEGAGDVSQSDSVDPAETNTHTDAVTSTATPAESPTAADTDTRDVANAPHRVPDTTVAK